MVEKQEAIRLARLFLYRRIEVRLVTFFFNYCTIISYMYLPNEAK
jgi:hypothetical protein